MPEKIKRQCQIEIGGFDFRAKFTLNVEGGDRSLLEEADELTVEKLIFQDADLWPVVTELGGEDEVREKIWNEVDNEDDEEWEDD